MATLTLLCSTCLLLLLAAPCCVLCIKTVVVSPTVTTSSHSGTLRDTLHFPTVLGEFTQTCQLNFSYVSDQPVSVWLSLDTDAQSLLILSNGRPCVDRTSCIVSQVLDPQRRYFLLGKNDVDAEASVVLNFTAAASSAAGLVIFVRLVLVA